MNEPTTIQYERNNVKQAPKTVLILIFHCLFQISKYHSKTVKMTTTLYSPPPPPSQGENKQVRSISLLIYTKQLI